MTAGNSKKTHILGQNFCCRLAEWFWGIYTQIEGSPAFCDLRMSSIGGSVSSFFVSLSSGEPDQDDVEIL